MEQLREEFKLWYFDPYKEGTIKEWAEKHHVSYLWCRQQKKDPSFIALMEEFRKTYREQGDEALQNLIRFSHSPEARVALPAIKILVEVMGYNAPVKTEVSVKGMSLADYLLYVQQHPELAAQMDNRKALPEPSIEGEFRYAELEPQDRDEPLDIDRAWETAA